MKGIDHDASIESIFATIAPDATDEEIIEATVAAFFTMPEEERSKISLVELQRRLAVYRSIEL